MDIVVTIPKSEYANDDAETEALLNEEGSCQFWTLSNIPKKLSIGDRVYFVKHSRVESSMRVFDIRENASQECDVTGRTWQGKCILYMDDLQYCETIIEAKGFQGFRYKWWWQ